MFAMPNMDSSTQSSKNEILGTRFVRNIIFSFISFPLISAAFFPIQVDGSDG